MQTSFFFTFLSFDFIFIRFFTLRTHSKLISFYRSINLRWLLMLKNLWNQTKTPKFDWVWCAMCCVCVSVFFFIEQRQRSNTFFENKVNSTQSPFKRPLRCTLFSSKPTNPSVHSILGWLEVIVAAAAVYYWFYWRERERVKIRIVVF